MKARKIPQNENKNLDVYNEEMERQLENGRYSKSKEYDILSDDNLVEDFIYVLNVKEDDPKQ